MLVTVNEDLQIPEITSRKMHSSGSELEVDIEPCEMGSTPEDLEPSRNCDLRGIVDMGR
jgi:hypothetical protein